jgi:hypothetical protein
MIVSKKELNKIIYEELQKELKEKHLLEAEGVLGAVKDIFSKIFPKSSPEYKINLLKACNSLKFIASHYVDNITTSAEAGSVLNRPMLVTSPNAPEIKPFTLGQNPNNQQAFTAIEQIIVKLNDTIKNWPSGTNLWYSFKELYDRYQNISTKYPNEYFPVDHAIVQAGVSVMATNLAINLEASTFVAIKKLSSGDWEGDRLKSIPSFFNSVLINWNYQGKYFEKDASTVINNQAIFKNALKKIKSINIDKENPIQSLENIITNFNNIFGINYAMINTALFTENDSDFYLDAKKALETNNEQAKKIFNETYKFLLSGKNIKATPISPVKVDWVPELEKLGIKDMGVMKRTDSGITSADNKKLGAGSALSVRESKKNKSGELLEENTKNRFKVLAKIK